MRRTVAIALVLIATASLLAAAAGCRRNQTAEANRAIAAANGQLERYDEAGSALKSLIAEADRLAMKTSEAAKGVQIADRMMPRVDEQRVAATAARAELTRIGGMDVPGDLKTYAEKEIGATDVLLKQDPVARALVADVRELFDTIASGKATEKSVRALGERIDERTKALEVLAAEAERRQQDAAAWYRERLGSTK